MLTFVEILESSKSEGRSHPMGYGWWIRSLTLELSEPDLVLLRRLLSSCPGLTRLRVAVFPWPAPPAFNESDILSVIHTCHTSLRRLGVKGKLLKSSDFIPFLLRTIYRTRNIDLGLLEVPGRQRNRILRISITARRHSTKGHYPTR